MKKILILVLLILCCSGSAWSEFADKLKTKDSVTGTGFIITRDGYILTCHHVIKDANEIKISVGGNSYPAKLIRDDPNNDLALLKINGSFPAIAFSSKRSAKMGQEVFTIGYLHF